MFTRYLSESAPSDDLGAHIAPILRDGREQVHGAVRLFDGRAWRGALPRRPGGAEGVMKFKLCCSLPIYFSARVGSNFTNLPDFLSRAEGTEAREIDASGNRGRKNWEREGGRGAWKGGAEGGRCSLRARV